MSFDADEIMRKVTEAASEKIHAALEEAKLELGAEGKAIHISDQFSAMDTGDNVNIAGITFPSEDVEERFLAIVRQKMQ